MSFESDQVFFEWLAGHDNEIRTVFDVGAYRGDWSKMMVSSFPDAEYHLFEPRLAFDDALLAQVHDSASAYKHHIVAKACGAENGKKEFSVQGVEGVGSSLKVDRRNKQAKIVDVDVITLDDYAKANALESIDFLKMDVQGGELDALRGCREILPGCKYLFLETWLVSSYGNQTPHMFEIFDFLRKYRIFPLAFLDGHRNQFGILSHIDVVYVNADLTKLPGHFYASLVERLSNA